MSSNWCSGLRGLGSGWGESSCPALLEAYSHPLPWGRAPSFGSMSACIPWLGEGLGAVQHLFIGAFRNQGYPVGVLVVRESDYLGGLHEGSPMLVNPHRAKGHLF